MAPKPLVELSPRVEGLIAQYERFYKRVERLSEKGTPEQQEWARRAVWGTEPQPGTDHLWNETVAVLDDPTVEAEEKAVLLIRGSLVGRLYPEDKLKANVLSEEALAQMRPRVLVALANDLWALPIRTEGVWPPRKKTAHAPIFIRYMRYSSDLARLALEKDPSEGVYALACLYYEYMLPSLTYGSDYDFWPEDVSASYLRTALEDIRTFNRAEKYRYFYPAPYLWPMTDEVEPRLWNTSMPDPSFRPLGWSMSSFANFAVARTTPYLCGERDLQGLLELQTFCEKKLLVQPTWYKFMAKVDAPRYLYREIGKSLAPGGKQSLATGLYEEIKVLKEAEFEVCGGIGGHLTLAEKKRVTTPFVDELRELLARGRQLIESLTPEDFGG